MCLPPGLWRKWFLGKQSNICTNYATHTNFSNSFFSLHSCFCVENQPISTDFQRWRQAMACFLPLCGCSARFHWAARNAEEVIKGTRCGWCKWYWSFFSKSMVTVSVLWCPSRVSSRVTALYLPYHILVKWFLNTQFCIIWKLMTASSMCPLDQATQLQYWAVYSQAWPLSSLACWWTNWKWTQTKQNSSSSRTNGREANISQYWAFCVETKPRKSVRNLGIIFAKNSPSKLIYLWSGPHDCTILRICGVFSVT